MVKDKFKIQNWSSYTAGLKTRGSITFWIDRALLRQWRFRDCNERKRGRTRKYSDIAILLCLTIRKVYHLALRQCQGFVESYFNLLGVALPVPDYTTLCRRASSLEVPLKGMDTSKITDIAVDGTGLKVYGEGEWKVRKYGTGKRRRWMKLHLAIDINTQQIEAAELTTNALDDAHAVKPLLNAISKTKKIKGFRGDGAYDKIKVRRQLTEMNIDQIIPPKYNARKSNGRAEFLVRDQVMDTINVTSREQWKQESTYHKRSLAETAMYRYKHIIGSNLQCREQKYQATEVQIGCLILNKMLNIAKPVSVKYP